MKAWTRSIQCLVSAECSKITGAGSPNGDGGSGFQDGDRREAGRAIDLAVGEPCPADLPAVGPATELLDVLVDLAKTGGADGLAAGQASAVGVDGQPPSEPRRPFSQQALLLAVAAKAVLGHVHDLCAAL